MRVLGLTGGIASGKSTVCRFLAPYPVIEADEVARLVAAPGQPGLQRIGEVFGPKILQEDGALNRSRLRSIIAQSETAQKQLNGILHPLILAHFEQTLAGFADDGAKIAFVCAALMLETGSYRRYEAVILVTTPFEVRLQRLLMRDGMNETTARQLMDKQWSDEKKRALAHFEITNDGDLNQLEQRTRSVLSQLDVPLAQAD